MIHLSSDQEAQKRWLIGPWNSDLPIPIGYANAGVDEQHYHQEMHEVYLVARGQSLALVAGREIDLCAGDILVVEPGEVHTFVSSTEDYLHFVIHAPFVARDKHLVE